MLKRGKADEGGGRFAKRPFHGADAFLDLGLALLVRQLLVVEIGGPRTVGEGQYDFLFAQEVELLEMLEAEAGPAGGVDGDDARDAERVRISAGRFCRRGRRCWWSRFCGWH